jgi:O-antigen ligase
MKNIHAYIALPWIILLANIPPINFLIRIPRNDLWFVLVLISAFFGIYTLWFKTDWKIKVVAIWILILCFFSTSFAVSFSSYVSVVLGCYFYINCLKIKDWTVVFRVLQTLVFLNVLLLTMQFFGHDTLLNWSRGNAIECYGAIGHHMQMGSFSVIITAMLLSFSIWNLLLPLTVAFFCKTTWTFVCAILGIILLIYFKNKTLSKILLISSLSLFCIVSMQHGSKVRENLAGSGRLDVWEKTIHFAMQKPWTGWGVGQYSVIFPGLDITPQHFQPYSTAHNAFLELLFETGIPFTLFVVWWFANLFWRLWRAREILCLAGFSMMLCDSLVHFPDRMAQCVPIIICFLAFCEHRLGGRRV